MAAAETQASERGKYPNHFLNDRYQQPDQGKQPGEQDHPRGSLRQGAVERFQQHAERDRGVTPGPGGVDIDQAVPGSHLPGVGEIAEIIRHQARKGAQEEE